MLDAGIDESAEERMRAIGAGLELGMGLGRDEEGVGRNFDHLDDMAIRGEADGLESLVGQGLAIVVVDFIAVTMALIDFLRSIEAIGLGRGIKDAGIGAKAHRSAEVGDIALVGHEMDDRMHRRRIEFRGIDIVIAKDVPGKLDDRGLKPKAES